MISSDLTYENDFNPTGFINTAAWEKLRRDVSHQRLNEADSLQLANERNPLLATQWSNEEYSSEVDAPSPGDTQRLLINECRESIVVDFESPSFSDVLDAPLDDFSRVDACFAELDQWLHLESEPSAFMEQQVLEIQSEEDFDRELEVMESVQQISLDIRSAMLAGQELTRSQISLLMEN